MSNCENAHDRECTTVTVRVDKPIGFDAKRIFPYLVGIRRATGFNCRSEHPDPRYGLSGEILIDVTSDLGDGLDRIKQEAEKEIARILNAERG